MLSAGSEVAEGTPLGYSELFSAIKAEVLSARIRAAKAVNSEAIDLYWRVGSLIAARQQAQGWGARVIDRLASDLRAEFPGVRGWSARSLQYMRTFAGAWPDGIAQQPAAQLPWGHLMLILDRAGDPSARDWYARQAVENGWSRATLQHHITAGRHAQIGRAPDNFTFTLPSPDSDLVREIVHDPYDLDFLAIDPGFSERQLEDALINRLTTFLTELGEGFAFVGRQYRLPIGDRDYFADLIFYHLGLRRFVVVELKVGQVEPEHLGKLSFYVTAVDDLLRKPGVDGPTIGILLAGVRDDVVVEYALRGIQSPLAVSVYTTHKALPADIRTSLPTPEILAEVVHRMNE